MNDKLNQSDFSIIIDYGAVVPVGSPSYNDGRINIELYDRDDYKITIEGETYGIKSDEQYKKIKEYISINLDKLIDFSKKEDKSFLDNNVYEGVSSFICIKYGQLLITINGAVNGVIGEFAEKFISEILEIIVDDETNVSERKVIEHTNDEKKQVINEWKEYLKLDEEEFLWINKNRAYSSKLYNILYSLKHQQDSDVIYNQYKLVSGCQKYINLFDKEKVTEIVNQLIDLENNVNTGIGIEKACEFALNYYGQFGYKSLDIIKDTGDKLLILPQNWERKAEQHPIMIDKASGKIEQCIMPVVVFEDLLSKGISINIPSKYTNKDSKISSDKSLSIELDSNKISMISKEIFNKINELPNSSEFKMLDYLKDYELETKEMFEVNKKVLDLCHDNNVKVDNLMSGAILGMPWIYPLKKN